MSSSLIVMMVSVPHNKQRYETVGDWYLSPAKDTLMVTSSKMSDPRFEALVKLHEFIEATLCLQRGVSPEQIDAFDYEFEARRPEGNVDEPGDSPLAPYRKEHFFATSIERLVAAELGVDWLEYEKEVYSL